MSKKTGREGVHPEADVEQDEDALIESIQKDYEFSIKKAQPFFDIMISLALEHDNDIDPDEFPTRTKSSAALKFAQVEEQLAFAMPRLWPQYNPVRVTPRNEESAMDAARNVERAVYSMAKYDMNGEEFTLPIARDCAKVGVGYGIIEPYSYAPLDVFDVSVENSEGETVSSSKELDIGEMIHSLRGRYITPGQIVPYPDGHCTNGPGRASQTFFWDFATERQFKEMVSEEVLEGLDFNVETLDDKKIDSIIDSAKNPTMTFVGNTFKNIKNLGGIDYKNLTTADATASAIIPILKVYREGEHVWLANGDTIIYRQAERVQTHRCPILKMSAVRDGMTWFPMSVPEAMRGQNFQKNVWMNLITDLMVAASRQPLVYSDDVFDGKAPSVGPDATIRVSGVDDVRKGAMFLQTPGIGADMLAVGDRLDQLSDRVSGHKDYTQKNFSRGGQHAFNDLINSSNGRELIAGTVMETGFMRDFYTMLLVYMQIEMRGYNRIGREIDEETGKEETSSIVVSPADFAHAFELSVSFDRHKYATEFSLQERIQLCDSKTMNDGSIDEYEKKRFLIGNDELLHRMSLGKKKTREVADENRADQRMAMQAAAAKGGQEAPAMPPTEAGAELGGAPAPEEMI